MKRIKRRCSCCNKPLKNCRIYKAEWYKKNKERILDKTNKQYKERREQLIEQLGGKCVGYKKVCGVTENLQFDHKDPRTKSFTIAPKLTSSIEVLYEEVDKCQLLCPDCHLEKTKEDYLNGRIHR